jgi:hypothetical protein
MSAAHPIVEVLARKTDEHDKLIEGDSALGFVVGLTLKLMVDFPDIPEFAPITDPEEQKAAFEAWREYSKSDKRDTGFCRALQNNIRAVLGSATPEQIAAMRKRG